MFGKRTGRLAAVFATVLAGIFYVTLVPQRQAVGEPARRQHVPEVVSLLSKLTVDEGRTHKNMIVFPIRWSGRQAPGDWETLDEAMRANHLQISEKDQASVPEIVIRNTGDNTVFLMSGEIVKGGKQTRVVQKDTIIEAGQKVAVPVFCVEKDRWAGGKDFRNSRNMVPPSVRGEIYSGRSQGDVWQSVRSVGKAAGADSKTESLDEMLDSDNVKKAQQEARRSLGKFSPRDTIGIAVADMRTGQVVGLELFGRRDLFEALQDKLIEAYTTDLVVASGEGRHRIRKVTERDVEAFIRQALDGTSKYEDTPGSGRGIDLTSGRLRGKGLATGDHAIHLSIQDLRPQPIPIPVRPIVDPRE